MEMSFGCVSGGKKNLGLAEARIDFVDESAKKHLCRPRVGENGE